MVMFSGGTTSPKKPSSTWDADLVPFPGGGRKYVVLTLLMVSGLKLDEVVRYMLLSLQPYFEGGFNVVDFQ